MSSKLDPFFTVLFDQLNQQGLSYRAVCKYLKCEGVVISPQALRSWHVRRSQKLMARAMTLPLSHACQSVSALTTESASKANGSRPHTNGSNSNPALQFSSPPLAVCGRLQQQIADEERKHALLSNSHGGGDRFLVRRKTVLDTNERQVQSSEAPATKKNFKEIP